MADQDYLQNIAGSPHVDEGLGDRILSRGSSALQRLASVGGGSFSDPNYTKIDSLFNAFLKKVTPIVKDFSDGPHSVANRLGQMRPNITPQDEAGIKGITDLYDLIVPTHLRKHQTANSVLAPRNASRSQLSELLKEGIFTRDMALNAALYSNNPTKIVNAYNKEIKKAYDTFLADAMKVTGAPKDYIKRVVGNVNPSWGSVLNKVEQVIGAQQVAATPPTTPSPEPAPDATATDPSTPSTPPAPVGSTEPQLVARNAQDDFVVLTANVIDILIDAVQGDEKLSAAFFKPSDDGKTPYAPLPQNWDEPSVTKEAEEPEAEPETPGDETGADEDEPSGEKHEFLYNFHSLYRKQRHFAIDVPIHDKNKAKFTTRQTKTVNDIQVVWSNASHENSIYVKYAPKGTKGKGGQVLLLKFWDNQVNPRNPDSNKFTIELLLSQANQNAPKVMAGANADLKVALNKKTEDLQRALYATTSRKRMEFKPKPFQLTHDEVGNVYRVKRDGTKVAVSKEELKAHLTSKDAAERERWTSSLEKIGYFKKFPEDEPKDEITIDKIPNAMDAVKALGTLGHKAIPSMKAVQAAVDALGKDAATDAIIKHALGSFKPATTTPAATPVSAPVSAPVSGDASAPVSAPVSAPASPETSPTPDKAPATPKEAELGKAHWDDKGTIIWEKPGGGKTVKLTPKQLKNMKSPRLELLLKKLGYFDKFPQALKEWLDEETVNPFDSANLL